MSLLDASYPAFAKGYREARVIVHQAAAARDVEAAKMSKQWTGTGWRGEGVQKAQFPRFVDSPAWVQRYSSAVERGRDGSRRLFAGCAVDRKCKQWGFQTIYHFMPQKPEAQLIYNA